MFAAAISGIAAIWIFGIDKDSKFELDKILIPSFIVEYLILFFNIDYIFSIPIISILFLILLAVRNKLIRRKLSLIILGISLGSVSVGLFIYSDLFWWPLMKNIHQIQWNLYWIVFDIIGLIIIYFVKVLRLSIRRILFKGNHLS